MLYVIYGEGYRRELLGNGREKGEVGREEKFVPTCLKVDQHSGKRSVLHMGPRAAS